MMEIEAAFVLYKWNQEEGKETLKSLGIKDDIIRAIKAKRTKYELSLAKARIKNSKEEPIDFFELLGAVVVKLGVQISSEVLLVEWIGLWKQYVLKIKQEQAQIKKLNGR